MTAFDVTAQIRSLLAHRGARPMVFVTVGSDHHRFDRLVSWVDGWLSSRVGQVDCVVQGGTAQPSRYAVSVDYLDHGLLQQLMAAAHITVVQGGPMSIVESRRHGKRPIVVPRLARLHEAVDDHQVAFCGRVAAAGMVDLAMDAATLHRLLDHAVANPGHQVVRLAESTALQAAAAVGRIADVADALVPPAAGSRPRVLLLGGAGRSGSTLLERTLAEVLPVTALGEVLHLWERGLAADELCGCSSRFSECAFWQPVGKQAYGGWDALDTDDLVRLRHSVIRTRHAPALLTMAVAPSRRLQRSRFTRLVTRLYDAARDVSGARLLVDSSKHPAYAMLLRRARIDLRCVLVVRDPRAVAYSWLKTVPRPEVTDREEQMPRYGAAYTAVTWTLFAFLYELLGRLGTPLLVVRYEDFVADPAAVVTRVLGFAGVPAGRLEQLRGHRVTLGPAHTVAGNPMRFTVGELQLRPDDAWRTGLSRSARLKVDLLTGWYRRRYGYR